jgi:hypothetical protein
MALCVTLTLELRQTRSIFLSTRPMLDGKSGSLMDLGILSIRYPIA